MAEKPFSVDLGRLKSREKDRSAAAVERAAMVTDHHRVGAGGRHERREAEEQGGGKSLFHRNLQMLRVTGRVRSGVAAHT